MNTVDRLTGKISQRRKLEAAINGLGLPHWIV